MRERGRDKGKKEEKEGRKGRKGERKRKKICEQIFFTKESERDSKDGLSVWRCVGGW